MTRLLLVDDQQLVREGLTRIFGGEPDLVVVGECSDGDEVERAVARCRPDVVLMDVRMKRMDGAEATRRLGGTPPVLVLTMFDDPEIVAAALTAGAAGFVLKDAPGEEIVQATRSVAAGKGWLDPGIAPHVLAVYRSVGRPPADAGLLSPREREVLTLIGAGATNPEIAASLNIAEGTVKTHVGSIFTKLDLRDRAAAIIYALRHGL